MGFKVMYNQLRRRWELLTILKRETFRVLHLIRRNLLKTYVSSLAVLIGEVVDAADGWAVDGGVVSVMIVLVDPVVEGVGSLAV